MLYGVRCTTSGIFAGLGKEYVDTKCKEEKEDLDSRYSEGRRGERR